MNLYERLNNILNREQRGVAKITGDIGGGSWAARTQGGENVVLSGAASIGSSVFYDMRTCRILAPAPNLDFIDVPLE